VERRLGLRGARPRWQAGTKIAGDNVNIIDDGTNPVASLQVRSMAKRPHPSHPVVVENGVLKSYLLKLIPQKKLGLQTTGNASRGSRRYARIGPGNTSAARLEDAKGTDRCSKEGPTSPEFPWPRREPVTGDYSRGASGLWISGGEFTYPVEEITVAVI